MAWEDIRDLIAGYEVARELGIEAAWMADYEQKEPRVAEMLADYRVSRGLIAGFADLRQQAAGYGGAGN